MPTPPRTTSTGNNGAGSTGAGGNADNGGAPPQGITPQRRAELNRQYIQTLQGLQRDLGLMGNFLGRYAEQVQTVNQGMNEYNMSLLRDLRGAEGTAQSALGDYQMQCVIGELAVDLAMFIAISGVAMKAASYLGRLAQAGRGAAIFANLTRMIALPAGMGATCNFLFRPETTRENLAFDTTAAVVLMNARTGLHLLNRARLARAGYTAMTNASGHTIGWYVTGANGTTTMLRSSMVSRILGNYIMKPALAGGTTGMLFTTGDRMILQGRLPTSQELFTSALVMSTFAMAGNGAMAWSNRNVPHQHPHRVLGITDQEMARGVTMERFNQAYLSQLNRVAIGGSGRNGNTPEEVEVNIGQQTSIQTALRAVNARIVALRNMSEPTEGNVAELAFLQNLNSAHVQMFVGTASSPANLAAEGRRFGINTRNIRTSGDLEAAMEGYIRSQQGNTRISAQQRQQNILSLQRWVARYAMHRVQVTGDWVFTQNEVGGNVISNLRYVPRGGPVSRVQGWFGRLFGGTGNGSSPSNPDDPSAIPDLASMAGGITP